jgi:hypothetical protein
MRITLARQGLRYAELLVNCLLVMRAFKRDLELRFLGYYALTLE